jgi:ribosomal protein S12 methylthiotransferase accessory factor
LCFEGLAVNRLHTSTRIADAQTTLRHAKAWAGLAGITAVSEITGLDCLGVPIFISERPAARANPFAFGKGRVAIESEVGAYMEGIESHFAEPDAGGVETRWGTVRDLAHPIFEFAPKLDCRAAPDQTLLLARAEDAETSATNWVPAELVFNPAPEVGAVLFGASSNGLASGNSIAEASLHALFELIERDIWSIEFVRNRSALVAEESLPMAVREIVATAARNGLRLIVRNVPNDYVMPFFAAYLCDPKNLRRRFFNGGWGCHLDRGIALMRAVTEAAQSRAAFFHGGRQPPMWDEDRPEADGIREQIETVSRALPGIRFDDVADMAVDGGLAEQWAATVACLRRVVDRPIYRTVYTPEDAPLQVVRLIMPLLEHFTATTMRVGPRMQAELEADADAATSSRASSTGG